MSCVSERKRKISAAISEYQIFKSPHISVSMGLKILSVGFLFCPIQRLSVLLSTDSKSVELSCRAETTLTR